MKKRTFTEMVDYIIEQIRLMPIEHSYKIQLVGMLTALQTKYEMDMKNEIHD